MAKSIFEARDDAGKPFSFSFHRASSTATPPLRPGLVRNKLVTPEVQVQVLCLLEETGSTTIGACIRALAGHPEPVGAVLALADAGLVTLSVGPISTGTLVSRTGDDSEPQAVSSLMPEHLAEIWNDTSPIRLDAGVERLFADPATPDIFIVDRSARRHIPFDPSLTRPGIYLATNGTGCYVGMGADVRDRVVTGTHLDGYDRVALIGAFGAAISKEEACVAERLLALYVAAEPGLELRHCLPIGSAVDEVQYRRIRRFVADAVQLLAMEDYAFTRSSQAVLGAGPWGDTAHKVTDELERMLSKGTYHLLQSAGVCASAVVHGSEWVLLAGSEVRKKVVRSAGSIPSMLRCEWVHSGVLVPNSWGTYRVTENLRFETGTAAANFVLGSKSPNLAAWTPVKADGMTPRH